MFKRAGLKVGLTKTIALRVQGETLLTLQLVRSEL